MGRLCRRHRLTALLDTNVLVRHFTGQPPAQARRATTLLREAQPGEFILVDLVATELVFVLQSIYQQSRAQVAAMLRSTLALPAIRCEHASLLHRTVDLYVAGHDFTDAYLMAVAEHDGISDVVSFDRGIKNVPGIRRIEP
jgi:predicted nucleic acid-binding protein